MLPAISRYLETKKAPQAGEGCGATCEQYGNALAQ
jgi:hypothetical protein